jgi:hypothetical protein
VYLCGTRTDQGRAAALLGSITDEEASFVEAPAMVPFLEPGSGRPFRDDAGALWINCRPALSASCPARVTEKGVQLLAEVGGLVKAVDRSGLAWLAPDFQDPHGPLWRLWRAGRVCGTVAVPGVRPDGDELVSDQPGSVFIWTPVGLHHFVQDESGPSPYRLAATYQPVDQDGATYAPQGSRQGSRVAYSSLGYLVDISMQLGGNPNTHYRLHLIPVPGGAAAPQPGAAPKP